MKKACLIILIGLFAIIIFTGSILALANYDQKVYKVSTKTKEGYASEKCSNCNINYNRFYESPRREILRSYNYEFRNYNAYKNEKTKKGIFGDYIKEYSVEIKNTGYTGKYFTVVFELRDKNGFEFTQSVTHYLRDGERKRFVYKDIQYERHEILNWSYKIVQGK